MIIVTSHRVPLKYVLKPLQCALLSLCLLLFLFISYASLKAFTITEDAPCSAHPWLAQAFCRQELPSQRNALRTEALDARRQCDWSNAYHRSSIHLLQLQKQIVQRGDYLADMPPWSAYTPHGNESQLVMRTPPPSDPDAPISMGDLFGKPYPLNVQTCLTRSAGTKEQWTFERAGPLKGTGGYAWFSAGWPDAGHLRLQGFPLWITAFGFAPSRDDGVPIGMPPLHIHHMHTSETQSEARYFASKGRLSWYARNGLPESARDRPLATQFDVHGDRQCTAARGGTDCLIRAFPPGFAVKVTAPLHTFYDINDVRLEGSEPLPFYAEYSLRWTKQPQREVRHFNLNIPSNIPYVATTTTGPGVPYPWHDDYLLTFDSHRTEYIAWAERIFPRNMTLARLYWHSHHHYTIDQWAISATASTLGLRDRPPWGNGFFANLTASGSTIELAQNYVTTHIASAQEKCRRNGTLGCDVSIRCRLGRDRWERIGSQRQERYNSPECDAWNVKEGEAFTILSFHRASQESTVPSKVWLHTVFYALAVDFED